jgi:hypothetical protein
MGIKHKVGNIWIIQNDTFETIMEFIIIFLMMFIIGTLVYFGFFSLFGIEYTWKSYFMFNFLFSLGGYVYVKTS